MRFRNVIVPVLIVVGGGAFGAYWFAREQPLSPPADTQTDEPQSKKPEVTQLRSGEGPAQPKTRAEGTNTGGSGEHKDAEPRSSQPEEKSTSGTAQPDAGQIEQSAPPAEVDQS